jgi:hypothetical protein
MINMANLGNKGKYGEPVVYAGRVPVVVRRRSLAVTSVAYGEYSHNYAVE